MKGCGANRVRENRPSYIADVGLVYSPRSPYWASKAAPSLLELRDIALYPSEDGCMSEIDTAFGHHLFQIAVAELVGDLPADA